MNPSVLAEHFGHCRIKQPHCLLWFVNVLAMLSIASIPSMFQLFTCEHPSRSSGCIVPPPCFLKSSGHCPRCINSFANSDTSVLDLLACLSLSATDVIASGPHFSQTHLGSLFLQHCLFLAAPAVAAPQPLHNSSTSSLRIFVASAKPIGFF